MPDWKKEYRVSDLFKRSRKEQPQAPATFGVAPPVDPAAQAPQPWLAAEEHAPRKEKGGLFRRKGKEAAEAPPVPQPPRLTVVPSPEPQPTAAWQEPQAAETPWAQEPAPWQPASAPEPPATGEPWAIPSQPEPGPAAQPFEPTHAAPTHQPHPTYPDPIYEEPRYAIPTGELAGQPTAGWGDQAPSQPPAAAEPPAYEPPAPPAYEPPAPAYEPPAPAFEPPAYELPAEHAGVPQGLSYEHPAPASAHASAAGHDAPAPPAAPPVGTATAVADGERTSVWKKELRASDMFRRRPRDPGSSVPAKGGLPADDASVWKKELRASDLFRRRERAPRVPGDAFSPSGSEQVSFWKKELRLADLIRRGPGTGTVAPAAAPPRERQPRWKRSGGAKTPAAPLAVPLLRSVNLLPREEPTERTKTSRVNPAHVGVAIAAVVVVGALAFGFVVERGRVETRTETKERLQAAIQAAQQPVAAAPEAPVEAQGQPELIAERTARVTALSAALQQRVAWDRVLRQVSIVMPADTWLRGLAGSAGVSGAGVETTAAAPGTVTLTGYSKTREGIARLLARLQTVPDLAAVQLIAATTVTIGKEDVVDFSIVGTLRSPAEAAAEVSGQ
ncbi:MAG: PilN domain-containing protein [Thermoleophilia bacterium]